MTNAEELEKQIIKLKERVSKLEKGGNEHLPKIYLKPYYPKITCLQVAKRLSCMCDIKEEYIHLLEYTEMGKITKLKLIEYFNRKNIYLTEEDKTRQMVLVNQICDVYHLKKEVDFLEIILGILYVLSRNDSLEEKLKFFL